MGGPPVPTGAVPACRVGACVCVRARMCVFVAELIAFAD